MYDWNWSMVLIGYELLWLNGLLTTLAYAVGTVVGGLVIGVLCGLGLLANRWWLTAPIHAYVEVFRCTPVLVQIVWFFFALPIVIGVEIPANVVLKITSVEFGVKGDTATGAMKRATLETGLVVNVPLFVNEGDKIKVDTRTGDYVERAQ